MSYQVNDFNIKENEDTFNLNGYLSIRCDNVNFPPVESKYKIFYTPKRKNLKDVINIGMTTKCLPCLVYNDGTILIPTPFGNNHRDSCTHNLESSLSEIEWENIAYITQNQKVGFCPACDLCKNTVKDEIIWKCSDCNKKICDDCYMDMDYV